jgi:predicted NBD/HSP70 family sugar kinase
VDHPENFRGSPQHAAYHSRTGRIMGLRAIGALAADSNPCAQEVRSTVGSTVGRVLAGAANFIDPDVIVFGAGVSNLGALLLDPICTPAE